MEFSDSNKMTEPCLVCNTRGPFIDDCIQNVFDENNKSFSNDRKLLDTLCEIINTKLDEEHVHSKKLCSNCYKICVNHDMYKTNVSVLKTKLCNLYNATQKNNFVIAKQESETKKQTKGMFVLPASKLQPLPADYQLNLGKIAAMANPKVSKPLLNLKMTIGNSVLTQSLTTSTVKIMKPTSDKTNTNIDIGEWSVSTLPTEIFSEQESENDAENREMEIDEECNVDSESKTEPAAVDATSIKIENADGANYIDSENFELLLEDTEEDGQPHTIVLDANNSILQMMSGQKLVYENGQLSLVMDENDDADVVDGQDSNDEESQIELQVSGDEETANAIIAAAQEQGGAFIKVESGEMYRVKSVQSAARPPDTAALLVAHHGDQFRCLVCENDQGPIKMTYTADAYNMVKHMKSQHSAKVYICALCGVIMRNRSEYATHIAEHTKKIPSTSKGRTHACGVCHKRYNSRTLLREHSNLHAGQRPHACHLCGKAFASKYTRQAHLKTHQVRPHSNLHAGQRPHACHLCGKAFASKYTRQAHLKTHQVRPHSNLNAGQRPHACHLCGKAFASKYTRQAHLKTHQVRPHSNLHAGQRPHACHLCGKAFASKYTRQAHLKTHQVRPHSNLHAGQRPHACHLCGKAFASKYTRQAHLKTHQVRPHSNLHAGQRPHACHLCGKAFASKYTRQAHLKTHQVRPHSNLHAGQRPHACHLCGKVFASKYTRQAHLKTHQVRPRPFKCPTCGKSFLSQQNLTQHEKTHLGIKSFVCNVCNKAFGTQHSLEVHGVVHSGRKPHVCTVCEKAFARRAELADHARIHTGERPFECEVCGARFSQRSNLHSHRRATHLADKRHACPDCPKRFKRRRLLQYHIKAAHTGERPLQCNVCRATFVYPEHYKKHVRIHNGERPYYCEICGKAFNSRDNRNTHRFVHSDKKPYECLACGASYMRKRMLVAHMNAHGHLAESIVVNQPRVTKVNENLVTEKLETQDFEKNEDDKTEDAGVDNGKLYTISEEATVAAHPDVPIITTIDTENMEPPQLTDENGSILRFIQVKMPDGQDGWVALND